MNEYNKLTSTSSRVIQNRLKLSSHYQHFNNSRNNKYLQQ